MPRGRPTVSKEAKEQILKRIKEEGVPVVQAAQEHGLTPKTIYQWLSKGLTKQPSILEVAKLKRENAALKDMLIEIMLDMSLEKKKRDDR